MKKGTTTILYIVMWGLVYNKPLQGSLQGSLLNNQDDSCFKSKAEFFWFMAQPIAEKTFKNAEATLAQSAKHSLLSVARALVQLVQVAALSALRFLFYNGKF